MPVLRLREVEPLEQATCLGRVVVRDGSLEVLPERRRLAELAPEPPEKADARLIRHDHPY